MLGGMNWPWTRQASPGQRPSAETEAPRDRRVAMSGKYLLLFKYLDGRFADRVVLTFGEIEDLLGFALPDPARNSVGWWTTPDMSTSEPRWSDSWILAKRTAVPNLLARHVVFDRAS